MNVPNLQGNPQKIKVTIYDKFKGVDFSTDPTQIDESRSPWAPNLISDTGGNPEKRVGWRTLFSVEAPVNGLFFGMVSHKPPRNQDEDEEDTGEIIDYAPDEQVYLIHGGSKIYCMGADGPELLRENVRNAKSSSFNLGGSIYILTGAEYLVYGNFSNPSYISEEETPDEPQYKLQLKDVQDVAYIPTTIIARGPTGGGVTFDNVNLITRKRKNKFLTTTEKTYQLDDEDLASVDKVVLNGETKTVTTDYTVDLEKGTVTFVNAMPTPPVAGQDNLVITFTCSGGEGYIDRILQCSICTLYGVGTSDRAFMTGNPDFPNRDFYTGLNDPTYLPDLGYSDVGTQGTAIMGYLKVGEYLAIVKEPNDQDSTIYLRSAGMDTEGNPVFPLKQGVSGVGAIARGAIRNLRDEPLFLSRTGVYAISTNAITYERTVQARSVRVDAQLTKEPNLENAVTVEWNGYWILCVNNNCYILDGNQNKDYLPNSYGDYVYECYFWQNIPAVCFLERGGNLYFGTGTGKVCMFNSDRDNMSRFSDDGQPIVAEWATKADDDGDFMIRKTMMKKGSGVLIKPYTRSSVKILARTDQDCIGNQIMESTMDIFDWEDIDFSRFTFNANDAPQVVPFLTKVKKYITLQLITRNDQVNEGFGVFGIIKRYTTGTNLKYVK